jgi:uncharacterized protein
MPSSPKMPPIAWKNAWQQDEARLLLAGPFPAIDNADPGTAGYSGSLIIAAFANLEAAKIWAAADPFVAAGVYQNVVVKPFRKTLPALPVLPDIEMD